MPELALHLMGGLRVLDATGREIRIASRKGRALLAYLTMHPGETQGRDRLAALLWEDADDELARTSLRQALAAVRKVLPPQAQSAILAEADTLALDTARVLTDVGEFRRALRAGTRTSLQEAARLYRGDLLEGFDARSTAFDEWLNTERLALRRELSGALQQLAVLCSAADDLEGAIAAAVRLAALEPLNEAAHRSVMELHARRHAYTQALQQYRVCRDVLRRELDVAPEPATEALYRDLMRRRRAAATQESGERSADPLDAPSPAASVPRANARPELRDATVLVARLAGLHELEALLDPEESHAVASAFQERMRHMAEEFGGRCDRRIGEDVTTVFGLPGAYGNEAERAVRAALMLQDLFDREPLQAGTPLHLRVGIAGGQVLCGTDIFPLTGPPMQVAHALAARAQDRQILLSDETRRSAGERIEAVNVAAADDRPPIWWVRALTLQTAESRPLVGRRPELAMITAALERCKSSGHGRAIVVRGEPGIGKTRLVEAVRAAAVAMGAAAHCVQALDFGQSAGRRPIAALALSLIGLTPDSSPAQRAATLERITASTGIGIDEAIFLGDLIDAPLAPEAEALQQAMDVATRQHGRSLALARLIESAAQRGPLLLTVEDVHWADSDEIARLGEIAAVAAQCPALFIMTTRSEGDPLNVGWRARARGCPVTTIDLAPLAEDEARELGALYGDLPAEVLAACIRRAEGYPLFLDQLLRAASAGADALPGSVRALVVSRADRLGDLDRAALRAAATLGQRCTPDSLRHLLAADEYAPQPLVESGLMRQDAAELMFSHAVFRDAIYESTLRSVRRDLHRRAADWFAERDAALRADHLAAADDERAAAAYLTAARAEQAALRHERALALAQKAVAVAREPSELQQTRCVHGESLLQLGRSHDALAAYREALDLASDSAAQGQAWFGIAAALRVMDRHEEALDALRRAETALHATADAQLRARMATLRGNLCFPLGRLDECLQAHEQARLWAEEAASPIDIARALGGLGDAWYQRGRMATAQSYFARCIDLGRRHGLAGVMLANLPMLGITQSYCGDLPGALESYDEALQLARRIRDLRCEVVAHLGMTGTLTIEGQLAPARRSAERALELSERLGARRFIAEAQGCIAAALIAEGSFEEALRIAEQALALARQAGLLYCGPVLLGVVARATRDPARRALALAEGESLLALGCVSHCYIAFYADAIQASIEDGAWGEARRYAAALEAYTREEPLPWTDLLIRRARCLAERGEGAAGEETSRLLAALRADCTRMNALNLLETM